VHTNNASFLIIRENLFIINDTGKVIFRSSYIGDSLGYGGGVFLQSLIPSLDSGFVIVGASGAPNTNEKNRLFVKYNKDGDTQFVKIVLPSLPIIRHSFLGCIQEADNSYLLMGEHRDSNNNFYPTLSKWDKQGNEIWNKQYNINKYGLMSSIFKFHGKILMNGTQVYPHPTKILIYKPFILKVDTAGNLLSTKYYTDTVLCGGFYFWMGKFNEDKLFVYGGADTLMDPVYKINNPAYIGMIDSNFNFIWRTYFTSPDYLHEIYKVSKISDGNLVAVGSDMSIMNHINYSHIVKLDSMGQILWERRYMYPNRLESHYLYDFAEADNKDIIAVGSIKGGLPNDSQNCWFLRLDSIGKLSATDSGFAIAPTGILEIGEDANEVLQLYPNPANNYVKVAYNIHNDGVLSVYDISGKRLITQNIKYTDHETELDISRFAKGT